MFSATIHSVCFYVHLWSQMQIRIKRKGFGIVFKWKVVHVSHIVSAYLRAGVSFTCRHNIGANCRRTFRSLKLKMINNRNMGVRKLPVSAVSLVSSLCGAPACDVAEPKLFQYLNKWQNWKKQINTHEILEQVVQKNCLLLESLVDFQLKKYQLHMEVNKTPTLWARLWARCGIRSTRAHGNWGMNIVVGCGKLWTNRQTG